MNQHRPLTAEEKMQIVSRYQAGEPRIAIAKSLNRKAETIRKVLADAGISLRPTHPTRLSDAQAADCVRRYQAGEGVKALATEYGVALGTIARVLHLANITVNPRGNRYRTFSGEELALIRQMSADRQSQREIADRLGTTQHVISRVMTENGIIPAFGAQVRGEKHGSWKGGRVMTPHGYVAVNMAPDHPYARMRTRSGYVLEHRLVMAQLLGRPLLDSETVHHINGDKTDNRAENLQLFQGRHGKGIVFCCADCGSRNIRPCEIQGDS